MCKFLCVKFERGRSECVFPQESFSVAFLSPFYSFNYENLLWLIK